MRSAQAHVKQGLRVPEVDASPQLSMRRTSFLLRPARSQKYQHPSLPASLPRAIHPSAGGSLTPRSQREMAIAETCSFPASSV
jgi:hypothetical protein